MAPLEWDATWGPEPGAPGLRPPTDRTVLAVPATILREASPCGQIRARHSRRLRKRSEEHTSELQSRPHLVFRLLLLKKNNDVLSYSHRRLLTLATHRLIVSVSHS